jgi:hypothetical protein
MTIIRAEIRKWSLKGATIEGKVFNDTSDVYDDGEHCVIIGIKKVIEASNFFLIETDFGIYKCEKDERG